MSGQALNSELMRLALASVEADEKQAFIPQGDPSLGGDPAAAAGGGDPAAAAAGGDPAAAGGGAPPPDPGAGGGGPSLTPADVQMIVAALQQAGIGGGGAGGAAGGGAGGPGGKPFKFDEGFELHRLGRLMAKIMDHLGIPVSAEDMIGQETAWAQGTPAPSPGAPAGGGGGAAGGAAPAGGAGLGPMQPMAPAKTAEQNSRLNMREQAQAIESLLLAR